MLHRYTYKSNDALALGAFPSFCPGLTIRHLVLLLTSLMLLAAFSSSAAADLLATSQMGYHPNSAKQAILYTQASSAMAEVVNTQTNSVLATIPMVQPTNANGQTVACQGGQPCLIADFSSVNAQGTYFVRAGGQQSSTFSISNDIYKSVTPTMLQFFDAMLQQNSPFHSNMHAGYQPPMTIIADGSFIMEAGQASTTLIRLGSAYRRNPSLFAGTDIQDHIISYVEYLKGLQGIRVSESNGDNAVRLGHGMRIDTAFVPGPTTLTEIDVYIPGNPPQFLQKAPVVSLCGADAQCIADAAQYYKCQVDEPCLKMTYVDRKGTLSQQSGNYGVSKGWGYEFGCYFDVDLDEEMFDGTPNPCMVFHEQVSREDTAKALLAFLEAYPAVKDRSNGQGNQLLTHSINTYNYIKATFPAFSSQTADVGYWGAALFLLYDYTGQQSYLTEAHSVRGHVSTIFPADATRGNEFYWEEYVRHKQQIASAGLTYPVGGQNPEEFFRGQLFLDYKDDGIAMSKNGERVFEKYRDTNFQNSRQILTMGLLASKTTELYPGIDSFVPLVADNQLAWMTGMNSVQDGVSDSTHTKSQSFIFGIGNDPEQFHSRYLIDTGYREGSNERVIGARGTGYQFLPPGMSASSASPEDYEYFDGSFSILGQTLGAMGNEYNGEENVDPFVDKTFNNGLDYIPGWINGAFDTRSEDDVIFNYRDSRDTYEYTETTNEMVATAIELLAYMDGRQNNKPRYDGTIVNVPPVNHTQPPTNTTQTNSTQTNTTSSSTHTLSVRTTPSLANIALNGTSIGLTIGGDLSVPNVPAGTYLLTTSRVGYVTYQSMLPLYQNTSMNITLTPILASNQTQNTGNIFVSTSPGVVGIYLDGVQKGTTDAQGSLQLMDIAAGEYTLLASKQGFTAVSQEITVVAGQNLSVSATLSPSNVTTNATITSSSTSLSNYPGSTTTKYMREDANATFTINSNNINSISWYVDGTLVQTTLGQQVTFNWKPGILYAPKAPDYERTADAVITAQSPTQTVTWNVKVDDVINPFFSSPDGSGDVIGTPDTQVHVFLQDKHLLFSHVNVTIQSHEGSNAVQVIHELNKNFQGGGESDWAKTITNVPYGNNYIVRISGYNNVTKASVTYDLNTERSHYRFFPVTQSSQGQESKKSNAAGAAGAMGFAPQLVYVTFGQDVIGVNLTQTITLDAKRFNGGIDKIEAQFVDISGQGYSVPLSLTGGNSEYGTWSAQFPVYISGLHTLHSLTMSKGTATKEVPVKDSSFYVVDDAVAGNEHLMLVYSILSHSSVTKGTPITFKIDARDSLGIESASIIVKNSRDKEFTLPLTMIGGNPQYGTWQGKFNATRPDSTYTVASLTLTNANESKTYAIADRSVYVQSISSSNLAGGAPIDPFSREYFSNLLKMPFVPTIMGFALMALLVGVMFITPRKGFKDMPDHTG